MHPLFAEWTGNETALTWQAVVTIVSQAVIAAVVTITLAWINRKSASEANQSAKVAAEKAEEVKLDLQTNTATTVATEKKLDELKVATARWQRLLEQPKGEGR